MRRKISPRVEENAHATLKEVFGTSNAGAEFVLNSWPALYKRTLHGLKGKFDREELMLLIDVMNGTILTPAIAGGHIGANTTDGIDLDGLDKKWDVGGAILKAKLAPLTVFEKACLEWWVQTFWMQEDHGNIEEYVATLI